MATAETITSIPRVSEKTAKVPVSRIPQLDLLRGIAVLLVLVSHMQISALAFGWVGVDLFFALSGFLISDLLFRELQTKGNIAVPRFWARRAFKIYPPYFVLIFAWCAFSHSSVLSYWTRFAFIQNYYMGNARHLAHLWSIAVEEHFYFLLPLLLVALRKHIRWIPAFGLALVLVCFAFACLHLQSSALPALWQTHLRVGALFCGVALNYLSRSGFRPGRSLVVSLPFISALALLPCILWEQNPRYLPLVMLTNIVFAGCALITAINSGVRLRPVEKIGEASYSIYLWHPVLFLFWTTTHFVGAVGYLCSALLAGILMHRMIEVPSLALRRRVIG